MTRCGTRCGFSGPRIWIYYGLRWARWPLYWCTVGWHICFSGGLNSNSAAIPSLREGSLRLSGPPGQKDGTSGGMDGAWHESAQLTFAPKGREPQRSRNGGQEIPGFIRGMELNEGFFWKEANPHFGWGKRLCLRGLLSSGRRLCQRS